MNVYRTTVPKGCCDIGSESGRVTKTGFAWWMLLSAACGTVGPAAADSDVRLLPAASGPFRSSEAPLVLQFSRRIDPAFRQGLLVEVDGIDVTQMLEILPEAVRFTPVEPLEPGWHELRLIHETQEGELKELGRWEFETRRSARFREVAWALEGDVQVMRRVRDDLEAPDSGPMQSQGGLRMVSRQADGSWRLDSSADVVHSTENGLFPGGREVDLNEYAVALQWPQFAVTLGHQQIPADSLVLSQFSRRGLSVAGTAPDGRYRAIGFMTRTEAVTGIDNFFGFRDRGHRTEGVVVSAEPFSTPEQQWVFSAVYVDGRGDSDGEGELEDAAGGIGGEAYAVIADGRLGAQTWRVRGEFARSRMDFDGVGQGFAAEPAGAYNVAVFYSPRPAGDGEQWSWNAGLTRSRVEPWFGSLGDLDLPSDRESRSVFVTATHPRVSVESRIALENDNVEADPLLPVVENRLYSVALTYSPEAAEDPSPGGFRQWFGPPDVGVSWLADRQRQVQTPDGYSGDPVNVDLREVTASLAFEGDYGGWSLNHTMTRNLDRSADTGRVEQRMTGLDLRLDLFEPVTVNPQWVVTREREAQTGRVVEGWLAGLVLGLNVIEDLEASVSYTIERQTDAFDGGVIRSEAGEYGVSWSIREPTQRSPGVALFSNGAMEHREGEEGGSSYQIFLGIRIGWQTSNPQSWESMR